MSAYDRIIDLCSTDFNCTGMGSQVLGGRDRDGYRERGRGGGGGGYLGRRQHGQVAQGQGLGQAIAREWRRSGFLTYHKRTPKKGNKNLEDTKIRQVTQGGKGGHTRDGGQKNMTPRIRYRQGTGLLVKAGRGGAGVRMMESGRRRK